MSEGTTETVEAVPGTSETSGSRSPERPSVRLYRDKQEIVSLEHALDRLAMVLGDPACEEVGLRRTIRPRVLEQELRDHLIGAAEIDDPDMGEIED